MNITVVWIIIAICTITYCIALFKTASDIEKDLVRENFSDTNAKLQDIQMRVYNIERRLNKMEQEVENLMVRDDWWNNKQCKSEDYYDNMPDFMEEE